MYYDLVADKHEGHIKALEMVSQWRKDAPDSWLIGQLVNIHKGKALGFDKLEANDREQLGYLARDCGVRPEKLLKWLAQKIDIAITD